jgi:hypothetical protein
MSPGAVHGGVGAFRSERSPEGESERRTERTKPHDAAQRASPSPPCTAPGDYAAPTYSIDLRKKASIRPCSGIMRNSSNPQDFA